MPQRPIASKRRLAELSSHAGHPGPATSDSAKGSQANPADSLKQRVSSPPVRHLLLHVGRSPTLRIETASLDAVVSAYAYETPAGDLFSRNKKAREIDRALTVLEEAGRLRRASSADGRGRPAEIWLPRAA